MKLHEIHLRDPFIFAENGVYYLYGTRRGPSTKVIPWQGLDVYTSTDLIEWSEPTSASPAPRISGRTETSSLPRSTTTVTPTICSPASEGATSPAPPRF